MLLFAAVAVVPLSFADTPKLSGNSHGTEISLIFSDGKASGNIILDKQTITLNDINIIEKNDRIYIIDKQNDLKIFSKQITSDKYLIIVKINSNDVQTKLRFIANSENINKNTSQRNLFDAMEENTLEIQKEKLNNLTEKELRLLEKQKAIDSALKLHEDRLANIAAADANKPHGEKTSQSILDAWEKYKEITGMALVIPEKTEEKVKKIGPVVVNHIGIESFLSIPHHQEWKKVLRYSVLVTDDSGHRYNLSYNEFVGNKLSDVSISGTIKDPDSTTIQSFNGTTDVSGEYLGNFLIPDQSTTRGEYVISVDAVKTFSDNATSTSSNSGVFFVFPSYSGSSNRAPIANAGINQNEPEHDGVIPTFTEITLDGSASSDPDGDSITYSWVQTDSSGYPVTLSGDTTATPSFTAPNLADVDPPGDGPEDDPDLIFELTVTDIKGKSDTDTVTVTITFVD